MRVLIVNTAERMGGAAIAAYRLMEALKNNGIKAKMLVRDKTSDQITVVALNRSWWKVWQFVWERIVIWGANRFKKHNLFAVDIANTGTDITALPEFQQADVIHLHWINQGMLSLNDIQKILDSGKPVVWTMHDMWPFTGICHHAGTCDKYTSACHHCEKLYRGHARDLAYRTFRKKEKLLKGRSVTFVACSRWLENLARKGTLTQGQTVVSIPNPINTNLFRPHDKRAARRRIGLPEDKKLLLFGSMKTTDKQKGMDYLVEACLSLRQSAPGLIGQMAVVVMGKHSDTYKELFPFPVYSFGYVPDEKALVDIYNAVDLFVTPSLQENLPNTIMEAMACGVPCVGFQIGGIPEMIDHLHNGYVAEYKSVSDLANGICWVLTEPSYGELAEEAARKAATHYSETTVAKKYIDVYNKITGQHA